jgi:hypothetical protein
MEMWNEIKKAAGKRAWMNTSIAWVFTDKQFAEAILQVLRGRTGGNKRIRGRAKE